MRSSTLFERSYEMDSDFLPDTRQLKRFYRQCRQTGEQFLCHSLMMTCGTTCTSMS